MEFADGGDLYQEVQSRKGSYMDEEHLWNVLVQITRGLGALHELNVLHRDLKSANVFLFKDGRVKLGDLNVSKVAKLGLLYSQAGTPYYASPEVWEERRIDIKSDIWSLGCVVYEAAALKPPFYAPSMESLYTKVMSGRYQPLPAVYSDELHRAVAAMLHLDPIRRPTCADLLSLPAVYRRFAYTRSHVHDSSLLDTITGTGFAQARGRLPHSRYSPEDCTVPLVLPRTQTSNFTVRRDVSPLLRARELTPELTAKQVLKENYGALQPVLRRNVQDMSADMGRNKVLSDCCDQMIGSYQRAQAVLDLLSRPRRL